MSDGTPLLTAKSRRVKDARRLLRRRDRVEQGLFLADGPKAVEGALALEGCVQEVFATPAALAAYADLLAGTTAVPVDDRALAAVSDSVTPAGLVAICRPIDRPLPVVLDSAGGSGATVAICAEVRDPGNAGTIIRTADAVAATAVVLAGESVDPYNPKTVRASVGSLFHVPLALERDPAAAVRAVREAGFVVIAADGAAEQDLFESTDLLQGRVAWIFGNEAHGLSAELAALADHRIAIPIPGRAESLNLATAAAVCLYAGLRARS